jgi:coenzyme F420 biosynthesis associated uncharacterized protein
VTDGALVDWGVAERVAAAVAGSPAAEASRRAEAFDEDATAAACAWARDLVDAYTGIGGDVPEPESVGRSEWTRNVLRMLADASAELEGDEAFDAPLPGPLGGAARRLLRAGTGAEAGVAAGYAARRVMGQYDPSLLAPERPPRLLFVAPNLASIAAELDAEPRLFLRWVALHEVTHAVQFSGVPWLRGHFATLLRALIAGAASRLELGGLRTLAGRLVRDPRSAASSLLRGELARAVLGDERRAEFDRLQAAMTVIEGHADHVMDRAGAETEPRLAAFRFGLERRRDQRGGIETIVARLLGFDLKLRQYRLGRAFCDAVVEREGVAGLNGLWTEPAALPTLPELEAPGDWLDRISIRI